MEELLPLYSNKIMRGKDEFEMFTRFFKEDREYASQWLDSCMQTLHTKDDDIANKLRSDGNESFTRNRDFKKSIECYTKALCNATYGSASYAIILANRSAVTYTMMDYKHCLVDLNRSLKYKCPENTKLKVHVRRIKCYAKLNMQEQLNSAVAEALEFLEKSTQINDPESARSDILKSSVEKPIVNNVEAELSEELPELKDGVNDNFLYASSAVRISYSKRRGRHVVANKQILPGDVLFIEKPLMFASVFLNDDMELDFGTCYHCLKTTSTAIPCRNCTRCIFCDDKCRESSWNEVHQWECIGMQADLWCHIGIAFPAFRVLIKGVKSGFRRLEDDFEADTVTYGCKTDNYVYFNKLLSNIPKMENVVPLLVCATIVVLYLQKQTIFFKWLMEQPSCPEIGYMELVQLIGGLITRHIAQLQCNSSLISHTDEYHRSYSRPIACAIYPSVSMMNHSCKPHIFMQYFQDTVVVAASETIEANEEVFNCYGLSYRVYSRDVRQEECESRYYFKCRCRVCD